VSTDSNAGEQVTLDGRDPTRLVPAERQTLVYARAIAQFAITFADEEMDNRPDPQHIGRLITDLTKALDRDDLETEKRTDFSTERGDRQ
jgi:uncharacterized caspase-like protein